MCEERLTALRALLGTAEQFHQLGRPIEAKSTLLLATQVSLHWMLHEAATVDNLEDLRRWSVDDRQLREVYRSIRSVEDLARLAYDSRRIERWAFRSIMGLLETRVIESSQFDVVYEVVMGVMVDLTPRQEALA